MTAEPWPEEQIKTVKTMWAAGFSASMIAAEVGRTRNSVISKVHRCGFKCEVSKMRITQAKPAPRQTKQSLGVSPLRWGKPVSLVPVAPTVVDDTPCEGSRHLTLMELKEHHCRFPDPGEWAPFTYCAQRVVSGSSWCHDHACIVFDGFNKWSRGDRNGAKKEG